MYIVVSSISSSELEPSFHKNLLGHQNIIWLLKGPMRGIMLSLTELKMILLALAYLLLYVALQVFEVGSSITLVTSPTKSPSSSMLNTLAFQALKLEAPSRYLLLRQKMKPCLFKNKKPYC
jgi:hypothetical protein